MSITRYQAAAARAGLGLSRDELAEAANVSARTIVDFERGAREPIGATRGAMKLALEAAGAQFFQGGVRLPAEAVERFRRIPGDETIG